MERILTTREQKESFRAYLGYSGWGPGQLESEMQTGSWITLPADPAIVFEKDSSRIWSDVFLTLDEASRHYADMPIDPSLN